MVITLIKALDQTFIFLSITMENQEVQMY